MRKEYFIGVDLGGTKVAIGIVNQSGDILAQKSFPTKKDEMKLAQEIYETSKMLLEEKNISLEQIISMGIGVPGTVDARKRVIVYANNLDFIMVPMVELMEQYFSFPIYMDNDANVAAWAEYKAGAGKEENIDSMIMVTLGTGVGAGFIVEGKVFAGCNQGAGEMGHMVIDMNGIPCNCGRRGCFESYASTTALLEQAGKAMLEEPDTILWVKCNGDENQLDGVHFFEAVRQHDAVACKVLSKYQDYLVVGLLNLINSFQPDVIVIGGGISKAGELLLAPVREEISKLVYTRDDKVQTRLVQARLGNEAGIIGAALLQKD